MDLNVFRAMVGILVFMVFLFFIFRLSRKNRQLKQKMDESGKIVHELNDKLKVIFLGKQENDRCLTNILDALPFPVQVKDVEQGFTFRYLNKKSIEEFGNGRYFKTLRDILIEENVKRIHEIDQQVYETGVTYLSQEEINCLDGRSYRTLVQKSTILFDGRRHVLIVRWKLQDLSDSQQKLNEINRQNEMILNTINTGLVYISPDFRVRWENISKFSKHPLIKRYKVGDFCYKSLYQRESPCPDCLILKAMKSKSLQKEELGSLEINEVMEFTVIPILNKENRVEGYLARFDDITKQKRAYCKLEEIE